MSSRHEVRESSKLYTIGRTIKSHLIAADRHREKILTSTTKRTHHLESAGLLLIEAKAQVAHGEWGQWLDDHGIKHRSAQLLMQEHGKPDLTAVRQEKARKHQEAARQNRKTFAHLKPEPAPKETPRPQPAPTQRRPEANRKTSVVAIIGDIVELLQKMNMEKAKRLRAFAEELLKE